MAARKRSEITPLRLATADVRPPPPRPSVAPPSPFAFTDLTAALASVGQERRWLIEGFIEGTPLTVWIAGEKSLKSWLAMYTSVCVATGAPWFGQYAVKRPGPVLYVDAEYGPHEFARRLARICRGLGRRAADVIPLVRHFHSYELALDSENEAARWLNRQGRELRPSLVVLDPWRNVLPGEENDTGDVKDAMSIASQIRDSSGAAVLIPHHLNRAGTFNGSRALLGRADLIVEGSDEPEPWYTARGRTIRRHDAIARRFTVRVEHDDDKDDTIAATRFSLRFEGDAVGKSELSASALKMLAVLQRATAPMSANAVGQACGISNGQLRARALGELRDAGLVQGGARGGWSVSTAEFFDALGGSK